MVMAQGEMRSVGRDVTVVRETGCRIALPPPTKAGYVKQIHNLLYYLPVRSQALLRPQLP